MQGVAATARQILRCWASLFTAQAIAYRLRLGRPVERAAMAVIVQEMVAAEAAGVMITLDPHTGDRSQIAIEGCYGQGVGVTDGTITPDRFCVDKVALEIRTRVVAPKPMAYRFDLLVGAMHLISTPPAQRSLPCLRDDEILSLARLGRAIERALGRDQDVEWMIGSSGASAARELFLLQTRPETFWSGRPHAPITYPEKHIMDRITALLASTQRDT